MVYHVVSERHVKDLWQMEKGEEQGKERDTAENIESREMPFDMRNT